MKKSLWLFCKGFIMFNFLYEKGKIFLGNGTIEAKRNKITGRVTLLLTDETTKQLFKKDKK